MPAMTTDHPGCSTVLLVHGAWHGAWCWAALQTELERRGVPSLAIDLPGHGLSTEPLADLVTDADAVAGALALLAERGRDDVVLVGHSYGGAVITEAAGDATNVAHLVYVAAFALDAGESVMGLLGSLPPEPTPLADAMRIGDDGIATLDAELAPAALYGDSSPEAVAAALARVSGQPLASFTQPVTATPRDRLGSTYVLCTRDQAVAPGHQRVMAGRCDRVVELDSDHSPMITRTGELADVIERLARR
jgi:pimeloyl-ACP methyl ester carboxylesterase